MNAYLMEALRQIMQQIKTTLDEHGDEITTTLQRVALGELKPVETLTPEELECARELFGWVAQHDPLKVWAKVEPLLPELIGSAADIALDEIFVDPGFGELPPSLKKLKDKRTLARLGVLLASYICYDQFHYPSLKPGCTTFRAVHSKSSSGCTGTGSISWKSLNWARAGRFFCVPALRVFQPDRPVAGP